MADNPGGDAAGGGDRRREEASPASQVAEPRREGFGASGFHQRFPDPRVSSMVGARYKAMSPARLPIARSPCLTIPPGFSPSALLESPVLLTNIKAEPSPTTGTFSMASIVSNTVTYNTSPSPREASNNTAYGHGSSGDFEFKPHTRSSFSPGLSSLGYLTSADPNQQEHEPPAQIHTSHEMESSQSAKDESRVIASHTLTLSVSAEVAVDELEQSKGLDNDLHAPQCDNNLPASLTVFEKSSEDGYNWRKYGQKHVKGCEFPRSYYKCTHPNCQMKKQLERSQDGHITEIVYKGRHDHPKPQPSRRLGPGTILSGQGDEKSDGFSSLISAADKSSSAHGNVSHYIDSNGIQEPSPLSASDDDVEAGGENPNYGNNVADDDEDPESKRRKMDATCVDATSLGKVNREPRVVVQTISEVDILDDGYRWRKYGQKVVKGNPNPRSYYKCTNAVCPVRKHVERASHDPKAVITTYEGKHNHDVPAARNTSHEASAPMNTNAANTLNSRMPTAMSGLLRNCDMRSAPNHYDHLPESNPISLDLGVGITPNTGSTVSGKNQTAETEHNHQMYFHGSNYSKMMMQTIPGMPVSAIYGSSGTGMYGSREDKGEGFSFNTQATNSPPNLYYSNAENMVFGP